MALGHPLSCSVADIPNEIKELLEDKAAAKVGGVHWCNVTGASLGSTPQVDSIW